MWGSSGDFGPGRFPPAEAGTQYLAEGAPDRRPGSHVEDLGPEVLKSDTEVAKHFKKGEQEKLCSLDFHLKEVKARFQALGL